MTQPVISEGDVRSSMLGEVRSADASNEPDASTWTIDRRVDALPVDDPPSDGLLFRAPYGYARVGPMFGSSTGRADASTGDVSLTALTFITAPTIETYAAASATLGAALVTHERVRLRVEAEVSHDSTWSSGGDFSPFSRGRLSIMAAVDGKDPPVASSEVVLWDSGDPSPEPREKPDRLVLSFIAEPGQNYLVLVRATVECSPGFIVASFVPFPPHGLTEVGPIGASSASLRATVRSIAASPDGRQDDTTT